MNLIDFLDKNNPQVIHFINFQSGPVVIEKLAKCLIKNDKLKEIKIIPLNNLYRAKINEIFMKVFNENFKNSDIELEKIKNKIIYFN
jgi:hypothetical protein